MEQKKLVIDMKKEQAAAQRPARRPAPAKKRRRSRVNLPVFLVLGAAALSIWGVIRANQGLSSTPPASQALQAPALIEPSSAQESEPSAEEVSAVAVSSLAIPQQYAQARIPAASFLDAKLEQYALSEEAFEKKQASGRVYTVEEMLEFASALTKPGTGASNIPAYKQISSDVKGWLRIPGTNIDYPVLQGPDTIYYEHRDINKNQSKMGVIWADSASRMGSSGTLSSNTIIYGHNWTNYAAPINVARSSDIMFGQVPSYHYNWFWQRFPYIYFSTEQEEMTWQVFAAFYTNLDFIYNYANPDNATYSNIINTAISKRLYETGVSVSTSDKILTLSTCTRILGNYENQRFVVMAKLIK